MLALNPRIVHASFTGYGEDGPIAGKPGFDQVLQCMTGVAQAQGYPGSEPKVVWGSVLDFYGASMLAMGISGALFNREKTGQPQKVEASLLSASMALQAGRASRSGPRTRNATSSVTCAAAACRQSILRARVIFTCRPRPSRSGRLWRTHRPVAPGTGPALRRHAQTQGARGRAGAAIAAGADDPYCAGMGGTVRNTCAVRRGTRGCGHVRPPPRLRRKDWWRRTSIRHWAAIGPWATQSTINGRAQQVPDRRAPMLGEHTQQVLAELGLETDAIAALRAQSAVF